MDGVEGRIQKRSFAMSIELTAQQLQALEERQQYPARVVNPRTNETFVLIHAEMYERVRSFLEEEDEIPSVREMYPLVSQVLEAEEEENSSREGA
jgi:hypothetical protein